MTVKELIRDLCQFDEDYIVVIGNTKEGWSNIDFLDTEGFTVTIIEEHFPVFSNN